MDDFEKELEEITQAAGETVVTHFSREIHIDPAAPGASEMDLKGAKVRGSKMRNAKEVNMNSMVLGYIFGIYIFVIPFLLGNILGFQDLDPSSSRVLRQQLVRDILQYGGGVLEMWKLQSLINRNGIKPRFLQCTTYSWTCVCQQSPSTVSLIESGCFRT